MFSGTVTREIPNALPPDLPESIGRLALRDLIEYLATLKEVAVESVTDAVVNGEIWRGIDRLEAGRRKANLELWFAGFRSRVGCLDWTREVAVIWGGLINEIQKAGFTVGIRDTMIAASAKHHGLTVATRNVDDFKRCGVPVINPFEYRLASKRDISSDCDEAQFSVNSYDSLFDCTAGNHTKRLQPRPQFR